MSAEDGAWPEFEHRCTEEIVCPYCGYEFKDSCEFPDSAKPRCHECDRDFLAERNHRITYSTAKIEKDKK